MSKTVSVNVTVVRDGKATTQNFPNMGYATFVAMQSACMGVLAMLQSWGINRVAAMVDNRPVRKPGGSTDLSMTMTADFGQGSHDISIGYNGISEQDANEISAALLGAVASVAKP